VIHHTALEPGSFRDPGGRIFTSGDRILRAVMPSAAPAFELAWQSGVLDRLVEEDRLVGFASVSDIEAVPQLRDASHVLEHPAVPFISHPYEWSFSLLKAAALFHLDLQIDLLRDGFTLSDATAYNVQFDGVRPQFIDHLSVRPYIEGEVWAGHRQFCMQFLNPLLMWDALGLTPNHWFRGTLEGVAPEDLARMLPLRKKLDWTVLTHVVAQAAMQNRKVKAGTPKAEKRGVTLPKHAFEGMLHGLRRSIAGMRNKAHTTVWGDYAGRNSYRADDALMKAQFVAEMTRAVRPKMMYDLGCNSGDYSVAALENGAGRVVGFDFDHGALELAYSRAQADNLAFLPLWLDAANPSPSQGWAQAERKGLAGRAQPDAMVALAFIHHIAIGRNVPLDMATDWLVDMAPVGIIEFPHKEDPMVQTLLAQREDIFPNYGNDQFRELLGQRARIVRTIDVLPTRTLYWYDRT
jgi:ribosomal protein L11 methylase PrmA